MNYTVHNMLKVINVLVDAGYLTKSRLGVYTDMMIMQMMHDEGCDRPFECVRADLFAAVAEGRV